MCTCSVLLIDIIERTDHPGKQAHRSSSSCKHTHILPMAIAGLRGVNREMHDRRTVELTLSPPILLSLYSLPYWSNQLFLIFNIRVLWHGARCQTPQLYFSDTLPGCHTLSQLTRLYTVKSSCHSADYPTRRGSVVQVAPTVDGWTRFATTTTVHLLTCGEMLSDEVILERRNGPRRLSDEDDKYLSA